MVALAALLARAALGALYATLRLQVVGAGHLDRLREERRPALFALWHGRFLIPVYHHRGQDIVAMVSQSSDGDFAAAVLHRLGYGTVRGSSSRGGREAAHALAGSVQQGRDAAIIPDGPRGPARVLKAGTVHLASQTGAAILPLAFAARPARRLRSWDRFLLPWPFARAVLLYGTPVEVARGAGAEGLEEARRRLEDTLVALEIEADSLVGPAARSDPAHV